MAFLRVYGDRSVQVLPAGECVCNVVNKARTVSPSAECVWNKQLVERCALAHIVSRKLRHSIFTARRYASADILSPCGRSRLNFL